MPQSAVRNPQSAMVEIAPRQFAEAPAGEAVKLPPAMLCQVIAIGGGEFRLRPIACEWVDFKQATLRALGLARQARTLTRLGVAGFIRMRRISPQRTQLHLPSLMAHFEAVESDPEFWTGERLECWRKAIG